MKLQDFDYLLPKDLIASFPLKNRSLSKLLLVKDNLTNHIFRDLPELLGPNDILVINDSKVINARFFGKKTSGAKVEFLLERMLDDQVAIVQTKSNSRLRVGERIELNREKIFLKLIKRSKDAFFVEFSCQIKPFLKKYGKVPLPPYIKREARYSDLSNYQTIYADPKKMESIAAPTAGLHFDKTLLDLLRLKGVSIANITLHVGMGTFKPIKELKIEDHNMHKERIEIDQASVDLILKAKSSKGRVICVGTTSLRCLESVYNFNNGTLKPFKGETDVFIYPGYKFGVVDSLITNFHLPKSTLLILVSAFAGHERIMSAYNFAIKNRYRFYSYGDAMFINMQSS